MDDTWDDIGYVISSRYRVEVLRHLAEGPATPSQIARENDISITHISRAIQHLRERSLVALLVPEERKKGRVYGTTERGDVLWEQIEAENLAE